MENVKRWFGARRNVPTLLFGLLQTGALIVFWLTPPGFAWIDAIALAFFGFGIGGLIVFLAGLIAVDLMPVRAAGAVKGLIGLFSYLAAATQNWISGLLIDNTKHVMAGATTYDFTPAFVFWIGASVLSMALALTVWNAKPQE